MLTIDALRQRLAECDVKEAILKALELDYDVGEFAGKATNQEIMRAFSEASAADERICAALHGHPIPDDLKKLGRYTGDNLQYHIGGGFFAASLLSARAEAHGRPIETAGNVLDFGCGTSRIMRFFAEFCPGPKYYASDVYDGVIDWGKQAFPQVSYLLHGNEPPLPVDAEHFDVIYAWSIFSHYEESLHWRWLDELSRMLRPGGLLLCTIHSHTIMERIQKESELRARMAITEEKAAELKAVFEREGYAFRTRYDEKDLADGGLDAAIFGLAYITRDYVRDRWSDKFDVLEHAEGVVSQYQDLVVLRKRA